MPSSPGRIVAAAGFAAAFAALIVARAAAQADLAGAPAFGGDSLDKFGAALLRFADVDGDGIDELAIGAPDADGAAGNQVGAVHLRSGAQPDVELQVALGNHPGERAGTALATLGDLDGDGVPDLVVGAPGFDGAGGAKQGRLFVLSGATFTEIASFTVDEVGIQLGTSLVACGDQDGDGLEELLVGAPHADALAVDAGAAFLVRVTGAAVVTLARFDGDEAGERLGLAVTTLADLDQDGVQELIVASPDWDGQAGVNYGRVQVFSGDVQQGCPLLHELTGSISNDQFGWAVAPIADPDGGGAPCLLVSFIGRKSSGIVAAGGASILVPLTSAIRRTVTGTDRNQYLGIAAAAVGDVDGDGVEDFALGSPVHSPSGAFLGGCVDLFSAAGSGGTSAPRLYRRVGPAGARFGEALATLGDPTGDGCPELLMGASGEIEPVTGNDTGAVHVLLGQRPRLDADRDHYIDEDLVAIACVGFAYDSTLLLAGTSLSGLEDFAISFSTPWYLMPGLVTDPLGQFTVSGQVPDLNGAPLTIHLQAYLLDARAKNGAMMFSEVATLAIN